VIQIFFLKITFDAQNGYFKGGSGNLETASANICVHRRSLQTVIYFYRDLKGPPISYTKGSDNPLLLLNVSSPTDSWLPKK